MKAWGHGPPPPVSGWKATSLLPEPFAVKNASALTQVGVWTPEHSQDVTGGQLVRPGRLFLVVRSFPGRTGARGAAGAGAALTGVGCGRGPGSGAPGAESHGDAVGKHQPVASCLPCWVVAAFPPRTETVREGMCHCGHGPAADALVGVALEGQLVPPTPHRRLSRAGRAGPQLSGPRTRLREAWVGAPRLR